MRKEVQAGAVIGAILILIMVGYSLLPSRSGHVDKKKDAVVLDVGKTTAADSSSPDAAGAHDDATASPLVTAGPSAAPAHTEESPAAAPVAPATPDGRGVNWGALLSADHVEDMLPVKTTTPAPPHGAADAPSTPAPISSLVPTRLPAPDAPAGTDRAPADKPHATTPGPTGFTIHIIESGDTFSSIARDAYGNAKYYKEIAKANPKIDSSHLRLGMKIVVPDKSQFASAAAVPTTGTPNVPSDKPHHASAVAPASINPAIEYRVQSNDSLYSISMKLYHTPNKVDAIYQLNKSLIGPDQDRLKLDMVLKLPEPPAAARTTGAAVASHS